MRRVSSVIAYSSDTHGVAGSNPGQVNFFFMQPPHCYFTLYCTKNYFFSKGLYFLKICNHTSSYVPTTSGANVDPTSQVCSSAMLVLPIVGNWKLRFFGCSQWHNVHTKFHQNPSSGWAESCGQTLPALYAFISCTSCKERITKRLQPRE
jgi:hypothetical protein